MPKSKPNKSTKKREDQELQRLGECLIALSAKQLDNIELDGRLREAVLEARNMHAHGALRRQRRFIGKLMRHTDPGPIRRALEKLSVEDRRRKAIFREAEEWRDRIADEGPDGLARFSGMTGRANPALADLVRELSSCHHEAGRRRILRRVFREVHRELMAGAEIAPGDA